MSAFPTWKRKKNMECGRNRLCATSLDHFITQAPSVVPLKLDGAGRVPNDHTAYSGRVLYCPVPPEIGSLIEKNHTVGN